MLTKRFLFNNKISHTVGGLLCGCGNEPSENENEPPVHCPILEKANNRKTHGRLASMTVSAVCKTKRTKEPTIVTAQ